MTTQRHPQTITIDKNRVDALSKSKEKDKMKKEWKPVSVLNLKNDKRFGSDYCGLCIRNLTGKCYEVRNHLTGHMALLGPTCGKKFLDIPINESKAKEYVDRNIVNHFTHNGFGPDESPTEYSLRIIRCYLKNVDQVYELEELMKLHTKVGNKQILDMVKQRYEEVKRQKEAETKRQLAEKARRDAIAKERKRNQEAWKARQLQEAKHRKIKEEEAKRVQEKTDRLARERQKKIDDKINQLLNSKFKCKG